MADLAKTACHRCREHKLKCSRELPRCDRCTRVGTTCTFPTPPDRKALAALRQPPRKRKTKASVSEGSIESIIQPDSIHLDDSNVQLEAGVSLSAELQELFYNTYFRCMFNPTLLFHRPTFILAFQEGHVPSHVLLAMYAIATIFLVPPSVTAKRNAHILRPLGDIKALGKQWAITAGQKVLQGIDQPTLDAVRTCQMLTLYWFSQGESQRNTMFSGIAYKAACTLGLNMTSSTPSSASTTSHTYFMRHPEWLEAEARRRCFWAVWFTQAINSDHCLQGMSLSEPILNLPLPIGDTAYDQGSEEPLVTVSASEKEVQEHIGNSGAEPSIMAELMKIVLIWAKVRDHVEAAQRTSASARLTELFDLESQLSAWSSALPPALAYSRRSLYEQIVVHQRPVFILVHAMFFQCRMVLHSSLVPKFGGLPSAGSIPSQAISMGAQISVQMAQKISELGIDVLALDVDPTEIASFVGYCLYGSASIHMTFSASSDPSLASSARANMMSNLKLVRSMKVYWSNLERLWFRLSVLHASQQSRLYTPTNEDSAAPTVSPAHLREINQLATESQDTSNLSEPLADSVLTFTLRKLKSNAQADPNSLEHSEKAIFLEQLSQLTDGQIPERRDWIPTTHGLTGEDRMYAASDQNTVDMTYMPASYVTSQAPPNQTSMVPFGFPNESDWWQFNLNDSQEPIFSYDTLFSLGAHV